MSLQALQPLFNVFNQFLPSVATFLVIAAVMSGLPSFSKKGQRQPPRPKFIAPKTKRGGPASYPVVAYTIPTSMRPKTSRHY